MYGVGRAPPPAGALPACGGRPPQRHHRPHRAELAPGGLVYRYLDGDDGLPGGEATFVICSFWLVDNLALAGQTGRARELFLLLLGCANDVGLLAEEVDPLTGELLVNFPQAFSHVRLIGAVLNLARAERSDHAR
jgi:GH15 family glucan-1,4-alpha-glucosidase